MKLKEILCASFILAGTAFQAHASVIAEVVNGDDAINLIKGLEAAGFKSSNVVDNKASLTIQNLACKWQVFVNTTKPHDPRYGTYTGGSCEGQQEANSVSLNDKDKVKALLLSFKLNVDGEKAVTGDAAMGGHRGESASSVKCNEVFVLGITGKPELGYDSVCTVNYQ